MNQIHQTAYEHYRIEMNRRIKEKEFCVYAEFIRLGKKYESCSELHELEEMEYYAKCLAFFKSLVNLETKKNYSFSLN